MGYSSFQGASPGSTCICPGVAGRPFHTRLFTWLMDPNSGPYVHAAGTLPRESSPYTICFLSACHCLQQACRQPWMYSPTEVTVTPRLEAQLWVLIVSTPSLFLGNFFSWKKKFFFPFHLGFSNTMRTHRYTDHRHKDTHAHNTDSLM